ncbi:MAG: carboxypeptidase-like regulatory domain-containing protein [Bryobacteraceae bacterium]
MNALSVILLAAQVFVVPRSPSSQRQDEPPWSLSGQVVNALTGEPVRGAQVAVQCASRNFYRQTTTDRGGMFSATGLGTGSCLISATHRDYSGIMGLGQPGTWADVSSGKDTSGVQVKLMPGGSISGRVVNDDGEPVEGCAIQVYSPLHLGDSSSLQQRRGTQTDDQGEFRIAGLTPDRYLLYAQCQESLPVERPLAPADSRSEEPAESWLPVFYPDSPAAAGATMLSVLPGTDLQNIEFKLKATPVVTVHGSVLAAPGLNVNVQLIPDAATGNPSAPLGGGYDQKDGTLRIDYVPPGAYRLQVSSMSGQPDSLAIAEQRITTGAARPEPVAVQLQMAPVLRGVVEDPPGSDSNSGMRGDQHALAVPRVQLGGRRQPQQPDAPPPKGWVQFMPLSPYSNPGYHQGQGEVHQDGSFEMQGLGPGRYQVRYLPSMTQAFVDSMQYGETKLERDEIEITAGAPGLLRIVLGAKGARVQIHLPDDSSSEKAMWTVFLIPAGKAFSPMAGGMPALTGGSGADLTYDNLAPGRYFVLGVQQTPPNFGINERLFDLIQSRLEPVDIGPGGATTITPKLFTSEEINRLALAFLQGENQ